MLSMVLLSSVGGAAVYDPLYPFHPYKKIAFESSNLPIVKIMLDERMADKWEDRRVSATMTVIWNPSGERNRVDDTQHLNYQGKIGIKYRGNSSFSMSDKKPFAVRIENEEGKKKDADILGMGADSDWALLAPYSDKSMMRDVLIFDLMRGEMDYVPTGKFCEVVLNDVYQGVYIMTARVRQGKHRINIKKPTADEGDGLTGGYHLEIDRNDGDPGFFGKISSRNLKEQTIGKYPFYQIKYPDMEDLTPAQVEYIKSYVYAMEAAVASGDFKDPHTGYRKYIDTLSIANYIIAHELGRNIDGYRLSTPIYKYLDSIDPRFKLSLWDFNLAFGNGDYNDGWSPEGWAYNLNRFSHDQNVPWMFKRVMQDEQFYQLLRTTWQRSRKQRLSDEAIYAKVDSIAHLLDEARVRNRDIYNRFGQYVWPNYFIGNNWEEEIDFLKRWIHARLNWLDGQWIANDVNKVENSNFETIPARGKNSSDIWLAGWDQSYGSKWLTASNVYEGRYAMSIAANSKVYQVLTDTYAGNYTFRAWVKTQGDPDARIYIRYHSNRTGQDEISIPVSGNRDFHLIERKDIPVSNTFVEVGFITGNRTGDLRLWVDNVEFSTRVEDITSLQELSSPEEPLRMYADRDAQTLYIYVGEESLAAGEQLEVYDLRGQLLYRQRVHDAQMSVRYLLRPNQVYIVRVGSRSAKISM